MTDDPISRMLHDAVDDLEPRHALADIRAAVGPAGRGAERRPWGYALAGAALSAAVIVGVFWVVRPGVEPTQTPVAAPSTPTAAEEVEQTVVGVYFLGPAPDGFRLFREFQRVPAESALLSAVQAVTGDAAHDPDYFSGWGTAPEAVTAAEYDGEQIVLTFDPRTVESLAPAPSGTDEQTARLRLQEVVYTAQAAVGDRVPVHLVSEGEPVTALFGIRVGSGLTADPESEVLARVNLSTPNQDQLVGIEELTVTGRADSAEANVPWRVLDGPRTVSRGHFTAEGAYDRLYPFEGLIDVSGLAPGRYTLEVSTDTGAGESEPGSLPPTVDTRDFVIEE